MKKLVVTDKAYISKNPLSQALKVEATAWLYCSGQLGIDPETGQLREGAESQTVQILENLKAVLEAGGSSLAQVVKTTVFLTDLADGPVVNAVYRDYFPDLPPTRSAVQVAGLARGARVEIECVAAID
ncbi:MAG: RidA family protein [Anaerolineales bacterium]|jgi:2-iminobutanoate/2-iminopropanoate deaminase|nr:MAG: RidA family protein [Anaerolineales bacterium]